MYAAERAAVLLCAGSFDGRERPYDGLYAMLFYIRMEGIMAYIDYPFYTNIFAGKEIPAEEFDALADAATDLLSGLCSRPFPPDSDAVRRAVAYQTELLYCQGGRDAVAGLSLSGGLSERLGDYTVGLSSYGNQRQCVPMAEGIPVSGMAILILRRAGLMSRAVSGGDPR